MLFSKYYFRESVSRTQFLVLFFRYLFQEPDTLVSIELEIGGTEFCVARIVNIH